MTQYPVHAKCEEECNRSGPASVWRVYAYLWSREGHVFTPERTIQHGTGLSERAAGDAIWALLERGVLEIAEKEGSQSL